MSIAVVAAACTRDQMTSPSRLSQSDQPSFTTISPLGNYSIPVPGDNLTNPTAPTVGTGIVVEAGTNYRVHVHGNITTTPNPAWDCLPGLPGGAVYGPTGAASYDLAAFQVVLRARNTDGSGTNPISFIDRQVGSDSVQTDILHASKQIEIEAGRLGVIGACSHNDGSASIPAWLLSGSQMVSVEKLTDVVQLNAVPNRVHPNTQVTFTASRDDGGNPQVTSWHWQPDSAQAGSPDNPCWWLNPCQMTVQGSGTMTVNTNFASQSAHVSVYSDFSLDVDQSSVYIMDSVVFTPKYDGVAGPAARWSWIPGDTATADTQSCVASATNCQKQMIVSGRMWAYSTNGQDSAFKDVSVQLPTLNLAVDRSEVGEGDTATFTGTILPARPAYQAAAWSWTADDGGMLTSLAPANTGKRLSSSRRVMPGPRRNDETVDSTVVEATNDGTTTAPAAPGLTQACQTALLTCSTQIYGTGLMKLVVNVGGGRTVTASTRASVLYVCPDNFPIDNVLDVGNVVIQTAPEVNKVTRLPIGPATITIGGPWQLLQVRTTPGWGKLGVANYRPSWGYDEFGRSTVLAYGPNPMPVDSWATFTCRVWENKQGKLTGSMTYAGHYNIDLK